MLHYIFSLNYIEKKQLKQNVIMVSNSFLTKKFLSVNRKKKSWSYTTKLILIIN